MNIIVHILCKSRLDLPMSLQHCSTRYDFWISFSAVSADMIGEKDRVIQD